MEESQRLKGKLPAGLGSAEGVGVVDFDERYRNSGGLQLLKEFLRLCDRNRTAEILRFAQDDTFASARRAQGD